MIAMMVIATFMPESLLIIYFIFYKSVNGHF